MKLMIKKGTTSKLVQVFIQDNSLTTGAGLTGLVFNSGSLTAYYYREGAASATAITLATMTLGTWATGGFIVADGTNMPGVYQLGIPDAAIASGASSVVVMLKGATNMAPVVLEIELVAFDEQDAVRLGLTAIPNATAGATNGLPLAVDNSGRVDVLKINGTSQTARDIGASVLLSSGSGTGQLDFTAGVVKANVTQCAGGTVPSGAIPNAVAGAAGGLFIAGANAATSITTALTANIIGNITGNLSGSVGSVTAGVTLAAAAIQAVWDALTANLTTANSIGKRLADDIDATVSSRLATSGYTAPDNATITTINSRLGAPTGASHAADVAAVKSDTAAIKAKTDNLPASPAATGDAMTLTAGTHTSIATDTQAGLTAQGYTTTRAGYLDTLSGLVAAIWATVVSDLSAVPTSTASIQAAISWVFMVARNLRTQTATTETVYKNDGVTAVATSAKTDNGTTFSRGKYA